MFSTTRSAPSDCTATWTSALGERERLGRRGRSAGQGGEAPRHRTRGAAGSEGDLRGLSAARLVDLEVRPRLEAEHAGDQARRHRLDGVVVASRPCRCRPAVRRRSSARCPPAAPAAAGSSRSRGAPGTPPRRRRAGRSRRSACSRPACCSTPCACCAAVRAFVTSSNVDALVRGVALDRLDEVRDQVVAAPQLYVDLRPGVLGAVPQPDEPVVEHDQQRSRGDRTATMTMTTMSHGASFYNGRARDPDRVLAAGVRAAVEPAEVAEDLEAGFDEQCAPLVRRTATRAPSPSRRRRCALEA